MGKLVVDGLRALSYSLSSLIYELITYIYNIFIRLCNSRVLDSKVLGSISERIGLLLGIITLFMVIISCVQIVLEPDKLTDKEKGVGNIVKKIILVIVMLGISSSAFSALYGIQELLIKSNIIGKFLLPYEVDEEKFGGTLSSELFGAFYYYDTDVFDANVDSTCYYKANQLKEDIIETNDFSIGSDCLNDTKLKDGKDTYIIKFNWLLCPIVGLGAVYFLFSYCLSVGIRSVQLAFLEIISSAAIISNLSPKKDTMFNKWLKLYIATYIDVFLRIMIINLSVFLIATILESDGAWMFWKTVEQKNDFSDTVIMILMILALLSFAKKAPDLLKDLFPSSASKLGLGITSPKKMFDNMLGGSYLNKGYDKVRGAAKGIGLLPLNGAKRLITGIDSAVHGKGFANGFWKNPSKIGQWVNKQRETFMPEGYKAFKEKREGKENVSLINDKWIKGLEAVNRLKANGFNNWDDVLDGENKAAYEILFGKNNKEYITSKMTLDKISKKEKTLRYNLEAMKAGRLEKFEYEGKTYTAQNMSEFVQDLDKAQKALAGVKEIHAEISKQNPNAAKIEQCYDFIKNNHTNPANVNQTHESVHIAIPKPKRKDNGDVNQSLPFDIDNDNDSNWDF